MPAKIPFRVIHASGQDDNHKAVELNTHAPTTKGWNSSRFCLYPQDIVIQLEERSRLRKLQILSHQYLIATKIEFYVGDVSPDTVPSLQNARYTRLGYVALSDNEKTGFKARELKSVHVDAVGHFVKFVIHKNHVNRHNLYNQVGIVAMNIIGDSLNEDVDYPEVKNEREDVDQALAGLANRPDYISPLDDLAFDMYQDPEIAQIIRKLEKKKQETVLQERYDFAKKLKNAIQDLQKVGEKLGKYEVEKRQAVESEDYDKAKVKKLQMDEYRLQVYKQLEINDLLEESGSRYHKHYEEPPRQKTPPRLTELPHSPLPQQNNSQTPRGDSPLRPYDERPLPAIKNKQSKEPPRESTPVSSSSHPPDERPLPASTAAVDRGSVTPAFDDDVTGDEAGNVTGEPEPMNEKDMREAANIIEVFGLPLVSKVYSKNWSFKEDALLEVYKTMSNVEATTPKDDIRSMLRAAVFLINRAIKDKVFAVYTAGLNLLKMILTQFINTHKVQKQDTSYVVQSTMSALLQKTGDTATRNRDAAKNFVIEESSFPDVKPIHIVPHECVKPFKLNIAPRHALSRTELVEQLYKIHTIQNSGLTVENVMKFCTQAIQHNAGEVREKAEQIIVQLYRDVGAPVKDYLPPDDDKTRKNVLYKQLFEAFDKIDGKPSKVDLKKQRAEEEKRKQQEVEALQQQLQQLKDMTAGKSPLDEKAINKDAPAKTKEKKDKKPKSKGKAPDSSDAPAKQDEKQDLPIDRTCIFCGEKNEQFTEEGLDLHYWKNCPILKRCTFCKQVVEISGLTEHLLAECDNKDNFRKCPRCTEAISKADFDQHVADKTCPPAEANKNHCPMCHQNLAQGEESWKLHLMGKDGCKANPRRLQALNKGKTGVTGKAGVKASKPGPGKAGAAKSPRK